MYTYMQMRISSRADPSQTCKKLISNSVDMKINLWGFNILIGNIQMQKNGFILKNNIGIWRRFFFPFHIQTERLHRLLAGFAIHWVV